MSYKYKEVLEKCMSLKESIENNYPQLAKTSNLFELLTTWESFLRGADFLSYSFSSFEKDLNNELIDFLETNNQLDFWSKAFKDKNNLETTLFWNMLLENKLVNSRTSLILQGGASHEVLKEVAHILNSLQGGRYLKQDHIAELKKNISFIEHHQKQEPQLSLWELLCLSKLPAALHYAFNTLKITPPTTNQLGQSPIHLAVISGSKNQVHQTLTLGCKLTQTTLDGESPLELAKRYHLEDMVSYLLYLNHSGKEQSKEKVTVCIDLGFLQGHYLNDDETIRLIEEEGLKNILPSEINKSDSVDFNLIANRLMGASARGGMQVGEGKKELKQIIGQHSYHKRAYDFYSVKIKVNPKNLVGPFTENQHWVLKKNTFIAATDIKKNEYFF